MAQYNLLMAESKTKRTLCLFVLDFRFKEVHVNNTSYALYNLRITNKCSLWEIYTARYWVLSNSCLVRCYSSSKSILPVTSTIVRYPANTKHNVGYYPFPCEIECLFCGIIQEDTKNKYTTTDIISGFTHDKEISTDQKRSNTWIMVTPVPC